MSPGNFDWFLHVMLFYHTRSIIAKQRNGDGNEKEDGDGDDFDGDGDLD